MVPSFSLRCLTVSDRVAVWNSLSNIRSSLNNKVLFLGDFNQVDKYEDKLGGSDLIVGWTDYICWKIGNGLIDIPHIGVNFTWCIIRRVRKKSTRGLIKAYV